ncbi:Uncharacterized protein ESCO_003782 [Escovopsis weberi]|uniref:Coiled-coil domain-containing protein 174 n=1 Tax=Escovopsis weberi TaxID=150374 RepID=A0A0M8N3X4_ESCWE|nr:Uncharacterized protein ESCO_003782 [Escovopsis weberi]
MPQDPNLYGQRPPKKQKRDTSLSSSLDFTAQLTSLMSSASSKSASRSRPPKESKKEPKEPKDSLFRSAGSKKKNSNGTGEKGPKALVLKEVVGTEDEAQERERARRKMESKARLYAAMKRGDYVPKENEAAPLVDFDRKWAEARGAADATSSDDGEDDDDDGDGDGDGEDDDAEVIEYEDEFGRTRRGTRADKERLERRLRRGVMGAEELERMSARPSAPSNLIYGDAVQAMAFAPDDPEKMEALARKRDRSATPPELKHYDADWEIRTKGTGFYKFSKDEAAREREMRSLEEERRRTEEERRAREEQKAARRREIEQRRRDMEDRRAKRQADSFLDRLS